MEQQFYTLPCFLPSAQQVMTIGSMSCEKVMLSQGDNNRITGRDHQGSFPINNRPTHPTIHTSYTSTAQMHCSK